MKFLAISSSPRRDGNSEILLAEFLRGILQTGADVEKVRLSELAISPCTQCGDCQREGVCSIQDDMAGLYPKIAQCHGLVLAAPIYFMAHCAQAKLFLDRCQVFWVRKNVLKQGPVQSFRRGFHLAVGATHGPAVFAGVKTTIRWVFDSLQMENAGEVFVEGVDAAGAIRQHPQALQKAYDMGLNWAN